MFAELSLSQVIRLAFTTAEEGVPVEENEYWLEARRRFRAMDENGVLGHHKQH